LHGTEEDERADVLGQGAADRRQGEDDEPDQDDGLPAEAVR
jgi:hypothetical protein